ncbi:MAG: EamA family transporter [Syntrophaceae bacterium]|nr:EamA family transporter [Syntrophaceae bacterium]
MSRWRGEMESVLSSVCFGIAPIFAKKGLLSGLHPFYGATIANATAFAMMILFVLFTGHGRQLGFKKPSGLFFAILSGLCNSLALISFFWAMSIGKVALVVPMTCIYPLFTMLVAHLAMKESEAINIFTFIGTFLIVIGVILTI